MLTGAMLLLLAPTSAGRVAIFAPPEAATLVHQCGRRSPTAQAYWRPTVAQVAQAERAVAPALQQHSPTGWSGSVDKMQQGWRVQATGLIAGGRRFLYLNYVPVRVYADERGPTIICDGGAIVFGATVEFPTYRVTAIDFNGRT